MALKFKVKSSLLYVSLIAIVWSFETFGQTFSYRYDFNEDNMSETAKSIERTEDGYVIGLVGTHPDFGWSRRGLMKIDEEGNVVNQTVLDSDSSSLSLGFSNSGDYSTPNIFFSVGSEETLDGSMYSSLIKYNDEGELIWEQTYGFEGSSYNATSGITTSDGGFVIVGETDDFPNSGTLLNCAFLLKYSSEGQVQWIEKYYSNQARMIGYSVDELTDGELVLSGTYRYWNGSFDEPDMFVIKTDPNGQSIWLRTYGTENSELPCFVTGLANGDILLHGNLALEDSPVGGYLYSARLNPNSGDVIWDYSFESLVSAGCLWNRALEKEDGSITLSGFVQRPDEFSLPAEYMVIAQLTSLGSPNWNRLYRFGNSPSKNGWSQDMVESNDGGFILAGFVWPDEENSQDIWIMKLDELGCLTQDCATNVNEVLGEVIVSILPNPCTNNIQIKTNSSSRTRLISIYNLQGNLVYSEHFDQNEHTTDIDLTFLSSGAYFLLREDWEGEWSQTKFFKK